jgi:hypothetical protein
LRGHTRRREGQEEEGKRELAVRVILQGRGKGKAPYESGSGNTCKDTLKMQLSATVRHHTSSVTASW